jgi:hypothetical protein
MASIKTLPKPELFPEKKTGINVQALEDVGQKFATINKYLENGMEVPSELTKNFVTFPLSDEPFNDNE